MKMAVITGCDSGIGRSLCKAFFDNGYSVLISYLKENPFKSNPNIFAQKLDMRNEKDIKSFSRYAKKIFKEGYQPKYIIHNAGVALGGPIENLPIRIFREVFEINYFGIVMLTQLLIPDIIENKSKIAIIGSLAGRVAPPFMSPYVSSKFAIRGFCASLRRELNPYGIKTILIEPGAIATPIWDAKKQDLSFVDKKYQKSIEEFIKNFIEKGSDGLNVDIAAKQIFNILGRKNPKTHYIIDKNRFSAFLKVMLPDKMLDKIFIKLFSMYYGSS